jgi:hypothetical protein
LVHVSEISPDARHALMTRETSERTNLGYTELDQKTYLQTRRQRNLIYGEVGSLLNYFQEQINKNSSFDYVVQLDTEEKITNNFWADARMIFLIPHIVLINN